MTGLLDRIGSAWRRERPQNRPIAKVNLLLQACNLDCPMCSMNLNNKEIGQILRDYPGASKERQLRLAEYKAFFDSIRDHKPSISVGGGEPMIFPYMVDLIEYVTGELGMPVGITTNGTLFTDKKIERLGRAANTITISIDGLEQQHDSIRGRGNFALSMDSIRKLLRLKREGKGKARIASLFCLHENNYRQVEEVADFLLGKEKVEHLTISMLLFSRAETLANHAEWVKARNLPDHFNIALTKGGTSSFADFSKMDFDWVFRTCAALKARYKNIRIEPDFATLEDLKTYFLTDEVMPKYFGNSCYPSRTHFTLISNGDVLFFPQCFQIKLGNIREQTPDEIWTSPLLKSIQDVLSKDLSPVCAHCCSNRVEKHTYG